ncbi:MAG TPA: hypothetical protein ENJ29_07205 [Bacteroidetes bacterium]|nr:hypothetical protein [Bacteroidota bacterium]
MISEKHKGFVLASRLGFGVLAVTLALAGCGKKDSFPVPRAEKEFRAAVRSAQPLTKMLKGDLKRFLYWTKPYAPLDLDVRKARDTREASLLKNHFFGAVGSAAGINSRMLLKATDEFHFFYRRDLRGLAAMKNNILQLSIMTNHFLRFPKLNILARWEGEDFRVNDIYSVRGKMVEFSPSPVMGLVPSHLSRKRQKLSKVLAELELPQRDFDKLLSKMEQLGVVAMVREQDGSVRVVQAGVSDNEAGLLFLSKGAQKPQTNQERADGKKFIHLEELRPNVFYYVTT